MKKSLVFIIYLLFISGKNATKKHKSSFYEYAQSHIPNSLGSSYKNYTVSQNQAKALPKLEFSARTKVVDDDEISKYDSLINVMRNIPAAAGVLGQGLIWSRELATASGAVIVIPIMLPILCLLATASLFVPDWTNPNNILYSNEWSFGGLKRMEEMWNKMGPQ